MILLPVLGRSAASLLIPLASLAAAIPAAAQQPSRPAQPQTAAPTQPNRSPAGTKPAPASGPSAATKPDAAAPANRPGGAQAVLLASFGDWGVYAAQSGRSKICYALTQPKDRQPKNLNRDPGYLFVSFRPAENVRNEIAVVMGFPTKDSEGAQASIGNTAYALLTKDENAWLRNPAEEGQAITAMSRGQSLVVKAESRRGNETTDRYSLAGFTQALERARKECP